MVTKIEPERDGLKISLKEMNETDKKILQDLVRIYLRGDCDLHDAKSELAELNGFPSGALKTLEREAHGNEMRRIDAILTEYLKSLI